MTASVLLRLAGPMQSWGVSSKFEKRDTQHFPTKSGIVGMVANALGLDFADDIGPLAALSLVVRMDRPGTVIRDFHTAGTAYPSGAGGWISASGKVDKSQAKLSDRMYLADAVFTAALGDADDELAAAIAEALRYPARTLDLGRHSCPPSAPILIAISPDDPMTSIARLPFQGYGKAPAKLRAVWDDPNGTHTADDQPVSFALDGRRFAQRTVAIGLIDTPDWQPA